jgi:hypothetical protein
MRTKGMDQLHPSTSRAGPTQNPPLPTRGAVPNARPQSANGHSLNYTSPTCAAGHCTSPGAQHQTSPTAGSRHDSPRPHAADDRAYSRIQGSPHVGFGSEPQQLSADFPVNGLRVEGVMGQGNPENPNGLGLATGREERHSSPLTHNTRPPQHAEAGGEAANPFLWVSPWVGGVDWRPSGQDHGASVKQLKGSTREGLLRRGASERKECEYWDPLAILRGRGFGLEGRENPSGGCCTSGWAQVGLAKSSNPARSSATSAGGDGLRQVAEGLLGDHRPTVEPYGGARAHMASLCAHGDGTSRIASQGLGHGGGGFSALGHASGGDMLGGGRWMALRGQSDCLREVDGAQDVPCFRTTVAILNARCAVIASPVLLSKIACVRDVFWFTTSIAD